MHLSVAVKRHCKNVSSLWCEWKEKGDDDDDTEHSTHMKKIGNQRESIHFTLNMHCIAFFFC